MPRPSHGFQCGRSSPQQSTEAANTPIATCVPSENMKQLQQVDSHIGPVLKIKVDDKRPALDSV